MYPGNKYEPDDDLVKTSRYFHKYFSNALDWYIIFYNIDILILLYIYFIK